MNKAANTFPHDAERASYDLLPTGVVCTDDTQRITFVNQMLLEQLGYADDGPLTQRRFPDLLSIGGKLFFETYFAPQLGLDGEVKETNFELVDYAGQRHSVLVNVRPAPTATGGYVYVVFPCADRREYENELKRARTDAEASAAGRANFISSMSHEIRTPLHAILEAGNFLYKDNPRADQLEFIQVLRQAGSGLLSIVNDILDLSKMDSGMDTLDPRPFHPEQLVRQVIDTYRPQCRERNVDLRAELPDYELPLLVIDTGKLLQVLTNLVSNATKFTEEGEIVVRLTHEEFQSQHQLHVRVSDSGIGIPADRLEGIFEPFVQAEATTQASYGGTGLGLAICQRILKAYGSDLEVTSEEGKGTTFSFTLALPAASALERQADQRSILPKEDLAPLNHLTILNVDDNRANLLINARYFQEWKLPCDQFTSGAAALEAMETKDYDLMLLDLRMPDMDGYELARRVRAHPAARINRMPLIALSASASKEVTTRMLDVGINGLVVKPFEPDYLHHMILVNGDRIVQERASGIVSPATADRPVDFSDVRDIFAGDRPDYLNFLRIVHEDMADALRTLRDCRQSFSRKDFGELKHSLISTLRVFRLSELTEGFEKTADYLMAGNRLRFLVESDQLIADIEAFDRSLRLELNAEQVA